MTTSTETTWFQVIQPAYESTGGITQTMYCLVCGAAIVVTKDDSEAAAIHINWHTAEVSA